MPITVELMPVGSVAKFSFADSGFSGPCKVHIMYVDINRFQNKTNHLSLNANVRNPGNTKATKAIIETVEKDVIRNRMWAYNGGIIILAEKITTSSSPVKCTLTIPKEYGVVNGGHTQQALYDGIKKNSSKGALIRIEVMEGHFSKADVAAISKARNTTQNVKPLSIMTKEGIMQPLIDGIGTYTSKVEWKENEKPNDPTLAGETLIHLLAFMDGHRYGADDHPPVGTGVDVHLDYFGEHEGDLGYLVKITREVIELRDLILSSLYLKCNDDGTNGAMRPAATTIKIGASEAFKKANKNNNETLFLKEDVERTVTASVLYPIMAAFRTMLEVKPLKKEVRWKKSPTELWKNKELRDYIWNELKDSMKKNQTQSKVKNDKQLLKLLTAKVQYIASYKSSKLSPTVWEKY